MDSDKTEIELNSIFVINNSNSDTLFFDFEFEYEVIDEKELIFNNCCVDELLSCDICYNEYKDNIRNNASINHINHDYNLLSYSNSFNKQNNFGFNTNDKISLHLQNNEKLSELVFFKQSIQREELIEYIIENENNFVKFLLVSFEIKLFTKYLHASKLKIPDLKNLVKSFKNKSNLSLSILATIKKYFKSSTFVKKKSWIELIVKIYSEFLLNSVINE